MLPKLHTVDDLVEDIYKNFELKDPLNINIQKVVEQLGGILIKGKKTEIKKIETGFIIELKEDLIAEERNKTVFELIGYLFLIMGYSIDKEIWKKSKFSKFQFIKHKGLLHYFAYSFMMPRTNFLKIWELCRGDIVVDTVSISKRYNVSLDTVSIRAKYLDLIK